MAELFERRDKSLMCPICGKFLLKADRRDDRTKKIACKKCNKWIWFVPCTGESNVHKIPERKSASGKRFY